MRQALLYVSTGLAAAAYLTLVLRLARLGYASVLPVFSVYCLLLAAYQVFWPHTPDWADTALTILRLFTSIEGALWLIQPRWYAERAGFWVWAGGATITAMGATLYGPEHGERLAQSMFTTASWSIAFCSLVYWHYRPFATDPNALTHAYGLGFLYLRSALLRWTYSLYASSWRVWTALDLLGVGVLVGVAAWYWFGMGYALGPMRQLPSQRRKRYPRKDQG